MNVFLWILQALLAATFGASGVMKVSQPKEKLAKIGLAWVEDFSDGMVKFIASTEILAALGLILPAATGIAPVLTPLAATGLVIVMAGAIVVHARRKEPQGIAISAVLLVLAAVVVWGRFGPYAF
jgi:uncharacterized membrane protein YphA (DoxX/SURF4 family)